MSVVHEPYAIPPTAEKEGDMEWSEAVVELVEKMRCLVVLDNINGQTRFSMSRGQFNKELTAASLLLIGLNDSKRMLDLKRRLEFWSKVHAKSSV